MPAVEQLIVDEIHAPVLIGRGRPRHRTAVQAQPLAPADPHAHLQPVEPIQTMDTLALISQPSRRSRTWMRK